MTLAMSTGWNSKRHADAQGIVEEILGLGIDQIEAGYALTLSQLEGLVQLLPRVHVVSIHNFCPKPTTHTREWGDDFLLSSLDEDKRKSGVQAALQTFEWAKRLRARVMVMHLGQVEMDKTTCKAIKQQVSEGNADAHALAKAVAEVKESRARLAPRHLQAVRRSLDDILSKTRGEIIFGFENRSDYYEIPNIEEMEQLLVEYGNAVGYWHDVGHAFMQEIMGWYAPDEHIRTLHRRLVGLHIHDSLRVSDHRAPGYGEIAFESSLKPYARDGVLQVLELHSRTTREEAVSGIELLKMRQIIR